VLISDFHYDLPEALIAQEPLADRAAARMLRLNRETGAFEDRQFRDFPGLLRAGDLVVFNNTRVFPARLFGRRSGIRAQAVSAHNPAARDFLHGQIEVLLTRQLSTDPNEWECLVRPGRKIGVGETLFFGAADELRAEVLARGEFGERHIHFAPVADFFGLVERLGHVPLPPYIAREDRAGDRERYQTVYAKERGSVAAPTAGLHFTPEILGRLRERGIETAELTLHVGLGTFQPVRVERIQEHHLHSEAYSVSEEAAEPINRALEERRRIVAVGTTTVRTLEAAAKRSWSDGRPRPAHGRDPSAGSGQAAHRSTARVEAASGETDLFIYPGFEFRIVGAMLTNFHLPESTLLMLVCAFAGRENVLRAYQHAVEQKYRFFSYGDCMWVE
jgi:S-adenosylmethionine:tRNA ribosyltransferase-isomerase